MTKPKNIPADKCERCRGSKEIPDPTKCQHENEGGDAYDDWCRDCGLYDYNYHRTRIPCPDCPPESKVKTARFKDEQGNDHHVVAVSQPPEHGEEEGKIDKKYKALRQQTDKAHELLDGVGVEDIIDEGDLCGNSINIRLEHYLAALRWIPVGEGLPKRVEDYYHTDFVTVTDGKKVFWACYDYENRWWEKANSPHDLNLEATHWKPII